MDNYYIKRDNYGLGVFYNGVPQMHGSKEECETFIKTHKPEENENRTPIIDRDNY